MRRIRPNVPRAVTGILLLLAVAAFGAATPTGPSLLDHIPPDQSAVRDPAVQVALVLSGDVGQYAGMCGTLGGTDSLTGTLTRDSSGPVAADDDVMYRGVLSRKTQIVACGTRPAPTEDQVAMCTATLAGSARMIVELQVNEGDRGAWIKMKADTTHPVTKSIGGCNEPGEWLKDYYPDGASGIGIETVPSGLLRVGTYAEEGVSLQVIRE